MKTIAMIQARMGSSRLPGKVMMDIEGKSMLVRVIERVQLAKSINGLWVLTTDTEKDEEIVRECEDHDVETYRGSEEDVLDRYFQAAKKIHADTIVRITADCPLIDPDIIDQSIKAFTDHCADYVSNVLERTFPRGLDTEVMSLRVLEKAWKEAKQPYERSHVTIYMIKQPKLFRHHSIKHHRDLSSLRWTVDVQEDLDFIREVYKRLAAEKDFRWLRVVELLEKEPQLRRINEKIQQKDILEG